jgi:hypothetical protein
MKLATGKPCGRRPMVLPANAAANAFCRCRAKARSSGGSSAPPRARRTPALLRWARKGVRARVRTAAGALAAAGWWVSHFHLHFRVAQALAALPCRLRRALAPSDRRVGARRNAESGGAREAGRWLGSTLWHFTSLAQPYSRVRDDRTTGAGSFADASRAAGQLRATSHELPRRAPRLPTLIEWPTSTRNTPDREAGGGPLPQLSGFVARAPTDPADNPKLVAPSRVSMLFSRARRQATFSIATTLRGAALETAAPSLPGSRIRSHGSFTAAAAKRPRIRRGRSGAPPPTPLSQHVPTRATKRPVDLVWRTSESAASTASDAARPPARYASVPAPARPIPPPSPAATANTSRNATVVCATTLDPALANRLADDVIRRIDQRARIERERRGR